MVVAFTGLGTMGWDGKGRYRMGWFMDEISLSGCSCRSNSQGQGKKVEPTAVPVVI